MNKPWDRQPGETAKAFAAFLLYRDLPAVDRVRSGDAAVPRATPKLGHLKGDSYVSGTQGWCTRSPRRSG